MIKHLERALWFLGGVGYAIGRAEQRLIDFFFSVRLLGLRRAICWHRGHRLSVAGCERCKG